MVECRQPTASLLYYSQPDFQGVTSLLEEHCRKRGFEVLFLPKFHPEPNFIEQCWGGGSGVIVNSLPRRGRTISNRMRLSHWIRFRWISCIGKIVVLYSLPLCSPTCPSFSNRSIHFMDAYRKGLNGQQAAWVGRKYHSHRLLPLPWRKDLEAADPSEF